MKKWIFRISAAVVLAVGIYLVFMYQVGNRIIDEMIDQQLAQLQQLELEDSGDDPIIIVSEEEDSEAIEPGPDAIQNEAADPEPSKIDSSTTPGEIKNPDTPKADSDNVSRPVPKPDPSVEPSETKNSDSTEPDTTINPKPAITISELEAVRDNVDAGDKVSIANMVLKKLTSDDIKELTNMLSGGLTPEEKKRAKEIAYSRFSGDEINTIYELYEKYMKE